MMAVNAQTQYWYNFATIKNNSIYINRYHAKVEKFDRKLKIFTAITSSSSIAAWAIWKDWSFVWSIIIAASQILTAVKPLLPFKERLRALSLFGTELDALALAAEEGWFAVSHGRLTDEEIHKKTMALKKKVHTAQYTAFRNMSLPEDANLLIIAEKEAMDYMTTIAEEYDAPENSAELANADQGNGVSQKPGDAAS